MAHSVVPLMATGDWIDAAWVNQYLRDNIAALWPYTTAGDLAYASGAHTLARLAKPGGTSLLQNTAGGVVSWKTLADLFPVVATHYNATGHTYGSTIERDMPNSSATITPAVTSTVAVIARVFAANAAGNCWFTYAINIGGTVYNFTNFNYGAGIGTQVVALAVKTGVTAGAKTVKLREKEGYGAGLSYTVGHLEWLALAIPE